MAPGRPITRSVARSSGVVLQTLDTSRVRKPKPYHCIICDKQYASLRWLLKHHQKHNLPFIDRERYRELRKLTAKKEAGFDCPSSNAATSKFKDFLDAVDSVELGALNLEELAEMKDRKRCEMWEWWWDGQGDDIRDLVLCGTENEIDVLGNAGALDLQNQNIQSAPDPHSREYRPQFSPAPTHVSVSDNTGYERLSSITLVEGIPLSTDTQELGNGLGLKSGDFDLIANHVNGKVTMEGILHFLSDVNIRVVRDKGESFQTGQTMAKAASAYIQKVSTDQCIDDKMHDHMEERKTRAAPINNLVAISQFREDREEFCLLTRGATKTWFGDYEASQFPVEVLRDYAQTLGDGIGSAQMRAIWEDDAHLLRQHTNGEQWRVSDRQAAPIGVAAGQ